jgi:release factor glutamine methyltransferase
MSLAQNGWAPEKALNQAQQLGLERLDAQQILCAAVQQNRAWLMAHANTPLTDEQAGRCQRGFQRLVQGEPLAYVLGEQGFYGLTLTITPAVLVPRADTETLVNWALDILASRARTAQAHAPAPAQVIDLGTGSGAIALAVKSASPLAQVCAVEASAEALAVAHANAQRLGFAVEFHLGDWWSAVGGQRFDLALSNPPYIAEDDDHLPALAHEPTMALTSGPDGLDALRQIIHTAPLYLQPCAWLLLEHGHTQGAAVRQLMRQRGFDAVTSRLDMGGRERCTGGSWLEVSETASP